MKKEIVCLSLLFVLFPGGRVQAQRDFSETVIQTTPVKNSIYMLEGQGGNIAVSTGEDGVLMIDDQFAELNERILAAIKKISTGPVDFVVNTHWHGDHTGGNELMHAHGARIVAHDNVRKRLSTKQVRASTGRVDEARGKEALPVLTYAKAVTIHFNDETIEVIHFGPGHTDGDSVVFFKNANVVHMGDLLFVGRFPFIDLDSGGDVEGYLKNIESVLPLMNEETRIIPGHGPLSRKIDLVLFRDMIQYFSQHVQSEIQNGKTLEAIQAAGIPEEYTGWAGGFINSDRWLKTLYVYYTARKQ